VLAGARDALDVTDALAVSGFGLLGIAGSFMAWWLFAWQMRNERAQAVIVAAMVAAVLVLTLVL
jgi:hypothetical protein